MDRQERRKRILGIIANHRVGTQAELLHLLAANGVRTTQATLSRDIHLLNITKYHDDNGQAYYVHNELNDYSAVQTFSVWENVRSVQRIQFLNVVKTTPDARYATVLAGVIDQAGLAAVAGTVAGNDTLVVISPGEEAAKMVTAMINDHLRAVQ